MSGARCPVSPIDCGPLSGETGGSMPLVQEGGGVLKYGAVLLGTFPYSLVQWGQMGQVRWETARRRRAADMLLVTICYKDLGIF